MESVNWREAVLRIGFLSGVWAGLGGSLFDYPFHRPAQTYLLSVCLGVSISLPLGVRPRNVNFPMFLKSGLGVFMALAFLFASIGFLWQSQAKYVGLRLGFWGRTSMEIAGGDRERAFEALSTAQKLVPGEGEYTLWTAYYYLTAKGDPNLAIRQIRKARETSDNPNLVLLEATAQLERNDLVSASRLIKFVEALEPHKPGVKALKGKVLQRQGRWEEACRAFLAEIQNARRISAERSSNLEDTLLRLASILEKQMGQYEEAAKYYRQFLELLGDRMPNYPEARLRLGDLSLNRFYDLENAERYYREALQILKENGATREAEEVEKILEGIQNRRDRFK